MRISNSTMPAFVRQVWTLVKKDLLIAAARRPISTAIRAFILPLAIVFVVSYAQYFFNLLQHSGVGRPSPVLSLSDAVSRSSGGRNSVAFVDNGLAGFLELTGNPLHSVVSDEGPNVSVIREKPKDEKAELAGSVSRSVILHSGKHISPWQQCWILYCKRWTIPVFREGGMQSPIRRGQLPGLDLSRVPGHGSSNRSHQRTFNEDHRSVTQQPGGHLLQ